MSMKRRPEARQESLWIASDVVASSPGHPFYEKLEKILRDEGFDAFVESECASYYSERKDRPSIPPGVYFRMLLIGYFERLDSERGICWRCADSLSLRSFLGLGLDESIPIILRFPGFALVFLWRSTMRCFVGSLAFWERTV
ncbi:MAG: transposase [Acidobacteriota bacterium]|nr:transposase [Acidobacteriota bacterium]